MKNYNDEFIVPIYKEEENIKELWGSGFFIGSYLISAAHVFKESSQYFVKYNNKYYPLKNFIYRKYNKYNKIEKAREDLQIYYLKDIKSPCTLFQGTYIWGTTLCLDGYSFDEKKKKENRDFIKETIKDNAYGYENPKKPNRLINCFSIYPSAKSGNSGCPIIVGNIVYGMIISGFVGENTEKYGSVAIRSDYINKILQILKSR